MLSCLGILGIFRVNETYDRGIIKIIPGDTSICTINLRYNLQYKLSRVSSVSRVSRVSCVLGVYGVSTV